MSACSSLELGSLPVGGGGVEDSVGGGVEGSVGGGVEGEGVAAIEQETK